MATKKQQSGDMIYDPVDDYPENGNEVRTPEEHAAAEGRIAPDQIPNYGEGLYSPDTSSPQYDIAVHEEFKAQARLAVEKEAVKLHKEAEKEAATVEEG